jgi:hypothetical protein
MPYRHRHLKLLHNALLPFVDVHIVRMWDGPIMFLTDLRGLLDVNLIVNAYPIWIIGETWNFVPCIIAICKIAYWFNYLLRSLSPILTSCNLNIYKRHGTICFCTQLTSADS